ncbi:MAG: hypothetical protein AAF763_08465 [Pseudomonadota bacterium]
MMLARTIAQLDVGAMPAEQARELAEFGFLQWLGGLAADTDYRKEAMRAVAAAEAAAKRSPAAALFRELLIASAGAAPAAASLRALQPRRRGGARSRRAAW